MARRVKYLNNKDMLLEIHKSKMNFSSFMEPDFAHYDIILPSVDKINRNSVTEAKRNKAKKLSGIAYETAKAAGQRVKIADCEIDYRTIEKTELIFRVMTFDHIPEEPGRKKNPKTIADTKVKLPFPPFQHWK